MWEKMILSSGLIQFIIYTLVSKCVLLLMYLCILWHEMPVSATYPISKLLKWESESERETDLCDVTLCSQVKLRQDAGERHSLRLEHHHLHPQRERERSITHTQQDPHANHRNMNTAERSPSLYTWYYNALIFIFFAAHVHVFISSRHCALIVCVPAQTCMWSTADSQLSEQYTTTTTTTHKYTPSPECSVSAVNTEVLQCCGDVHSAPTAPARAPIQTVLTEELQWELRTGVTARRLQVKGRRAARPDVGQVWVRCSKAAEAPRAPVFWCSVLWSEI